jgi:hypothetical protein
MIVGRRPFNAAGLDLLTIQLTETPPAPSTIVDVPADVDLVVLRCLAHDSSDRFADVQELSRALEAVLAAHPAEPVAQAIPVRAVTPLPAERPVIRRLRTEVQRMPVLLLVVSAVLLAAGLGLLVAYFV